ncbi:mannosyltransferase [Coniothyrium glycines]
MRLPPCATAIVSATLLTSTLATPLSRTADAIPKLLEQSSDRIQRRNGDTKYFHEPGGDDTLGHYDIRYFHGVVSDEERTDTQSHMARAYLTFFRENELDTWIAHGTLLGWWWNGKRLPWDFDLDTQVSYSTLHHLGEAYNQTRYHYISRDGATKREFLLDVNPWIWQREQGDGQNIIDARWIDIRNGLFIDITGLAETKPEEKPGVWNCKNDHFYKTTDLYPMRETMFEGVLAKVPYEYDKILVEEYREKALIITEFEGHRWDEKLREWVPTQATKDRKAAEEQKQQREARTKALERAKLD